jgi:penicillin amidase
LAEMPRSPLPGHPTTVRVQTPTFGASQRSVVSPGREENAILVTPGGQSGLPTSPHFRSLHKPWQDGLSYPLRPSDTTARVVLAPRPRESSTESSGSSAINPSNR